MPDYLCISVTFLDGRFHGKGDRDGPEWPPSPLRLMQAIVAANADQIGAGGDLEAALAWLECCPPPVILAPAHVMGTSYCLSVPNNAMDLVGKAWTRGNYFGGGDASPATHRTMKTVRPIRLVDGETVHYLWSLADRASAPIDTLARAARRLVCLGWGIDLVVGDAACITEAELNRLPGERWQPVPAAGPVALRVPIRGTMKALERRHEAFVHRMSDEGFVPVPPLTRFRMVGYRRPTDPVTRPFAIFELRHDNGQFCRYPQRRLIHIAGMVRHLAKEVMQKSPPPKVDANWIERYIVGHQQDDDQPHRQLSYLPLPSIGHTYTDPAIRRMIIAAPLGDDEWLEHVARRLAGQQLIPEHDNEFGDQKPPTLVRVYRHAMAPDSARRGSVNRNDVVGLYIGRSRCWASVTPVILPGHDDHKPAKTCKLIQAALAQSGIEQRCTFEWSAVSRFPKSYSAHKYDRQKRPVGYFRPGHLQTQTAVHLTLRFEDEVFGPLAIGAGRHCGLGLFASVWEQEERSESHDSTGRLGRRS